MGKRHDHDCCCEERCECECCSRRDSGYGNFGLFDFFGGCGKGNSGLWVILVIIFVFCVCRPRC